MLNLKLNVESILAIHFKFCQKDTLNVGCDLTGITDYRDLRGEGLVLIYTKIKQKSIKGLAEFLIKIKTSGEEVKIRMIFYLSFFNN